MRKKRRDRPIHKLEQLNRSVVYQSDMIPLQSAALPIEATAAAVLLVSVLLTLGWLAGVFR